MSRQLQAITGYVAPSRNYVARVLGFANGLRARAPRYFDRKPGWIVQEIRDMQRRQTDWQFMASHGYNPKRWDT